MPWSRYAFGYHGCDALVARNIVAGMAPLLPSRNDHEWLGHGQYFWEDSVRRAMRWAEEESRKTGSRVQRPAVLGAIIDLGNCLNLIEAENLDLVRDAHEQLRQVVGAQGDPMPENTGRGLRARRLDCAVFEILHQYREQESFPLFDPIRAFFVEGEPLYPTAGIRQLDHVQICVRNPASIIGYFLPRDL